MATGNIDNTSDETFTYICSPCAEDGKNVEAAKYCVECKGYCCQPCADLHKTVPVLKKHSVLDKAHFQSAGAWTNLPALPTKRCSKHKLKVVDMYCENDDEVGCATCMAFDHRSCQQVCAITDSIESVWQKSEIEDMTKTLEKRKAELLLIISAKQPLLGELESSKNEAVSAVKSYGKEMRSLLKDLERKMLKSLDIEFETNKSKIIEEQKSNETLITLMNKHLLELQQAYNNKSQQFVCSKLALQALRKTDFSNMSPINDTLKFNPNNQIEIFLKNINSLGNIKVLSSSVFKQKSALYKVKSIRDLNVKTASNEEVCDINDMCLHGDGSLLIVDFTNKQLKRTNKTCTSVESVYDFQEGPQGVCCISDVEVAVTYNQKYVDIVSIEREKTEVKRKRIYFSHSCYSITCSNRKIFVTGYINSVENLYIYDLGFNHLKTLWEDTQGKSLCRQVDRVAVNDIGNKTFVTDWNNGVVILDGNENYIKKITEQHLERNSGICTDRRGNILLCGAESSNVVQISEEGNMVGVILGEIHGIEQPQSVCFNASNNTLFVSLFESDVVKVFELE